MQKLRYDMPVEVNKKVYDAMMEEFEEIVAGTKKNGKYYIKLWMMESRKKAEKRLNKLIKKHYESKLD